MIYPVLTYSRDPGDFSCDLKEMHAHGLKAIRLIYKGKSGPEFNLRIGEIQQKISEDSLDIDILIDLPGSKPIVGNVYNGLSVQQGSEYHVVGDSPGTSLSFIPVSGFFNHESFPTLVAGDIISIADDELNLIVKEIGKTFVSCEALNSYHLTSGRSVSVKNKPFPFAANSERDKLFVQHMEHTAANIRLLVSFTKNADDIKSVGLLQPGMDVIPKIETVLDDTVLLEIMAHCQTIVLGRGDLSTSSRPDEMFVFQKRLIDMCRHYNKKLIIGTGLLTGIGDKKTPTIPEIMDYGYLRSMGIDAFLITGSNAQRFPLETLQFMNAFQ